MNDMTKPSLIKNKVWIDLDWCTCPFEIALVRFLAPHMSWGLECYNLAHQDIKSLASGLFGEQKVLNLTPAWQLTAGLMKSGFHAILTIHTQAWVTNLLGRWFRYILFYRFFSMFSLKASHGESQLPGQPRWPNASWRRYTKPQSSTGLDTDRNISNIYKYLIFSDNNLYLYSDLKKWSSVFPFFPNRNSALFSRSCILYSSDALPVDLQDLAGSIAFDGCAAT